MNQESPGKKLRANFSPRVCWMSDYLVIAAPFTGGLGGPTPQENSLFVEQAGKAF
jgi:hypothetical protein